MSALDLAVAMTVTIALAMIGAVDARRMIIDFRLIAILAVAALLWHLAGSGTKIVGVNGFGIAAGAIIGTALITIPIAAAEFRGRRWPAGGGDALLLGATGLLLGPIGIAWALVAGVPLALAHRACVQRRRRRPFAQGSLPFGPGLCAGAILVFLAFLASGSANAQKPIASAAPESIAAVELAPERLVLPSQLAARQVAVSLKGPVPFDRLVAELKQVSGLSVLVEERPGRVSGATIDLPPPPLVAWTFEGSLQDLLWSVRERAGYAAELRGEELVLYRHRDADWWLPTGTVPVLPHPVEREASPGLFAAFSESWLGRLLGAGSTARADTEVAAPYDPPPAESPAAAAEASPSRTATTEPSLAEAPRTDPPSGKTAAAETAPAEAPAQGFPAAEDGAGDQPPPDTWPVLAAEHETLEGVLASWADTAGWTVIWRSTRRYALSADAEFRGDFLAAVDQLLTDAATRRSITATAHGSNRHLVIDDVEGGK